MEQLSQWVSRWSFIHHGTCWYFVSRPPIFRQVGSSFSSLLFCVCLLLIWDFWCFICIFLALEKPQRVRYDFSDFNVDTLFPFRICHANLSGDRQHKICPPPILSLKGRNIQYRLFITSTNKTKRVSGAIVHFFPDWSHYCWHVHGLLNKRPFYKRLMNRMHLLQLFSSQFKHRAALNDRAGFSRQADRLYVSHYAAGFLPWSSASEAQHQACVTSKSCLFPWFMVCMSAPSRRCLLRGVLCCLYHSLFSPFAWHFVETLISSSNHVLVRSVAQRKIRIIAAMTWIAWKCRVNILGIAVQNIKNDWACDFLFSFVDLVLYVKANQVCMCGISHQLFIL